MANLGLHHLIQAIANAVAEAQDKIHRFQLSTVSDYFDENNRPKAVDVRMPSLSPDAEEGEERIVRVPLLSLVGPQLLSIKAAEINFEIGLTGIDDDDPPKGAGAKDAKDGKPQDKSDSGAPDDDGSGWRGVGLQRVLGVDVGGSRSRGPGAIAKVTLKVESQPPSDGMARLIQQLDKLI
ncbi:DUF2589 domain-containing protein [Aerophototrophica crusticola]|uniref:DUF2589 domain-containing protein n=1 Tax=Aerophototrophica crusticola TaxID=1709002 RepID=A0A858R4U5_9PROT|nr:DUF2589 domain-containing protein [Rhodospirillaceae bacterium B3]